MYPTQRFQLSEYHNQSRRRTLISLTPLIDVVFILLIFFMLATSFLDWRVMQIDMPKSVSTSMLVEGTMVITILDRSSFEVEGNTKNIEDLRQLTQSKLNIDSGIHVLIQPNSGIQLQDSISLIDKLKIWGVQHIGFVSATE